MTPKGTRICAIKIPEACFLKAPICPTGSPRLTICSKPRAMVSIDFSVMVNRSIKAASLPLVLARFTSRALAANILATSLRTAVAIFSNARFFCSLLALAIARDAALACWPIASIICSIEDWFCASIDHTLTQ